MKIKLSLIAFLLLMGGWPAQAQVEVNGKVTAQYSSGIGNQSSPCSPAGSCVALSLQADTGSVAVAISGTFSGTMSFYVSADCTTFTALTMFPPNSTTGVTSTTGSGNWSATVGSYCMIVVRGTSYSSGAANIHIRQSNAVAANSFGGGGGGGGSGCVPSGGASGNMLTDSGSGTCTSDGNFNDTGSVLAAIEPITVGIDNSLAGAVQVANGSANAHTTYESAATTSNIIKGFATAPTSTHLIACVTVSVTCTLTDSGIPDTAAGILAACTGCAPIASPTFTGTVTLPTTNVPTGVTLTIQSGGTLNCAAGSTCPSGSGNTTSTSLTTSHLPKANGANSIIDSSVVDNGTAVSSTEPASFGASVSTTSDGTHPSALVFGGNTTLPSLTTNTVTILGPPSATPTAWSFQFPTAIPTTTDLFSCVVTSTNCLLTDSGVATSSGKIGISSVGTSGLSGTSPMAISSAGAISINANGITATQLAAQYSKGSCTELWGGSGTSFALTSGDDAVSNNSCYNDSGVTRTITAVKCRSSAASNTTTVNPTFGSAGTGTTILSGALTCGNSYAYSSTGTVSNASWTTGAGITPAMSGTLTGTSIAMIVEYTY